MLTVISLIVLSGSVWLIKMYFNKRQIQNSVQKIGGNEEQLVETSHSHETQHNSREILIIYARECDYFENIINAFKEILRSGDNVIVSYCKIGITQPNETRFRYLICTI